MGHILRCCAFPLSEQVSHVWTRCPGPMAFYARNSMAAKFSFLEALEDRKIVCWRRHPVTVCKALMLAGSMRQV